jgi:hypothetical protein
LGRWGLEPNFCAEPWAKRPNSAPTVTKKAHFLRQGVFLRFVGPTFGISSGSTAQFLGLWVASRRIICANHNLGELERLRREAQMHFNLIGDAGDGSGADQGKAQRTPSQPGQGSVGSGRSTDMGWGLPSRRQTAPKQTKTGTAQMPPCTLLWLAFDIACYTSRAE